MRRNGKGNRNMRWLILIGDEDFDLNTIKSLEHYGCIGCYDVPEIKGRYCVDYGEDHIFYDYDDGMDGYDEEDLLKIPYSNPHFITMIYTSETRVRNVLSQEKFPNIYVDNDFGIILPLQEFIQYGMPLDNGKVGL